MTPSVFLFGRASATVSLLLVLCSAGPCLAADAGVTAARQPAAWPTDVPQTASPPPTVTGASVSVRGSMTILSFPISGSTLPSAYVLGQPDRVIVDLPQVDFRVDPDVGRARTKGRGARDSTVGGLISSFRFGLFAPGKSRIVIDLTGPARVDRADVEAGPDGSLALVVALAASDQQSFKAAAASPPPEAARPAATAIIESQMQSELPVVVLDPGHGGVDTGALGPPGVVEKNITFAFADAVAADLLRDGRVKPVLTRHEDVFVPLGQRVRIARQANASLFMSIHADSIVGAAASVSGATVYTVSNRASDAEAARFAAKENHADAEGGLDDTKVDDDQVADILFDLARRETRAYSNVFAHTLMQDWRETGRLNKNPHRSAGFVVLKAPDVPSVLLELGYLSNASDVRLLTNDEWRAKAALSVAHAIERFFDSRRGSTAASVGDASLAAAAPAGKGGLRPSLAPFAQRAQ